MSTIRATLPQFSLLRKSPVTPDLTPTPLELASGLCLGEVERELPPTSAETTPFGALEKAILPALTRPPCLVAFSGGRDSSAMLALAAATARKHGLEPPVPVTNRYEHAPRTHEADWQEAVIRHVGANDWVRLDVRDELDYLGATNTRVVRRHGVIWPPNYFFVVPILERAGGGSLVTGDVGDASLAGGTYARIRAVLGRRVPPEPRDVLRLIGAATPAPVRRLRQRRDVLRIPWLREHAQTQVRLAASRDLEGRGEPVRFDSRIRWFVRRRWLAMAVSTGERLAADTNAQLIRPLLDWHFHAALARTGGAVGWANRTEVMRALFGELLPERVLARTTKAEFSEVYWGPRARAFAEEWSGEGADRDLVDVDVLRAEWLKPHPMFPAGLPLLAAWARSEHGSCNRAEDGLD